MTIRNIVPYTFRIILIFYVYLFTGGASIAGEVTSNSTGSIDLDKIQILDLKTARKIAIAGNPSIAAAEERAYQARQRVLQARSAYLPRLDATGSGSRMILSENDYQAALVVNPSGDDTTDSYRAGLSATWTLFDGFGRWFSNLSARHGEDGSREARMDTIRLILSAVSASYYNAQLAGENITIAEANEAFNRRQLEEAKARHRVGTGSLSDVLNFEVRINSAKAQLIQARQAYEVSLYGLAALMGIPDAKFPSHLQLNKLKDETQDELISPVPEALIQYALDNRPDLRQRDYSLLQAKANVGSARSEFYPTIGLSASYDGDRTDDMGFEGEDFGKSVGISVSYNLFSGGYSRAKLKEAKSRLREAESSVENLRINVKEEVESAIAQLKSAQEQLLLQRSNAKLVQQTRDLVEKEYSAGQGSLVRLNEAQRDLVTAQSRLALSLVSMRQAWENLKTSTAEILASAID